MDLERAHQIARERGPDTRSSTGSCARSCSPFFRVYFRLRADRPRAHPARGPGAARLQPPQLLRPVPDRHLPRAGRFTSSRRSSCSTSAGRPACCSRSAPSRSGAASRTRTAMETARIILERGGAVGIFPGGHPRAARARSASRSAASGGWRSRPARRSCRSRSSAPRTSARGWRIRPRRVTRPLRPRAHVSRARSTARAARTLAAGGHAPRLVLRRSSSGSGSEALPPIRTAAVVGAGSWGTAVAALLARGRRVGAARLPDGRAGRELARSARNERYLPGVDAARRR